MRKLGIAVALLALAGCGDEEPAATPTVEPPVRACTEIGCSDGVYVELHDVPRDAEVTLCVDDRCRPARAGAPGLGQVDAPLGSAAGDAVRVAITVRRDGRTIARGAERLEVRTEQPNGPGCPPVCRMVTARFDMAAESLQAT